MGSGAVSCRCSSPSPANSGVARDEENQECFVATCRVIVRIFEWLSGVHDRNVRGVFSVQYTDLRPDRFPGRRSRLVVVVGRVVS